jgi:hypothetical protein
MIVTTVELTGVAANTTLDDVALFIGVERLP